jgi:hypothetical protein
VSQKGCWASRKLLVLLRLLRGKVKKGWKGGKRGRGKRVDKGSKRGLNRFPLPPTFLHFIISASLFPPFVLLLSTLAAYITQSFPNLTICLHKADICPNKPFKGISAR